ncbi:MAG: GSCFA domain-containing protein [Methylococcaceae bacterium]|nr:GSCFA domain-containing protein [Prolixibacteraceae bacterium]
MAFITEINIPEFPWKMDYSKSMMFFGSCFSENIGQKLLDMKFNIDLNPFGILYNPVSIANSLKILLEKRLFTKYDLFQDQGQWNSFYHHSRFSDTNRELALEKINSRISQSHEFLAKADFLLITFGTSWVYEYNRTGQVVSNCHKVPSSQFKRYRLDVSDIADSYSELIKELIRFNPKLKLVFTVSPIRHWKDGAVENQVSKSVLLLAIDQLVKGLGNNYCKYFPSYEIMMDELRDYRFYADDMIHISPVGIDYIFERFSKVMITPESLATAKQVGKIRKALAHRPVNWTSPEYEKFLSYNLEEINKLTINFPYLNFTNERKQLDQDLADIQKTRIK